MESAMEITPRTRDLGGFTVGRVLPYAKRRMVGPFVFFDVMGPADFAPGKGIDVRPHPHIGLSTVTYLFNGELRHRDNLDNDQVIRPGDVNWMTAGRGIVHSERTDAGARADGQRLYGVQSWVALPEEDEATEPDFQHHPKDSLPTLEKDGLSLRLIAGAAYGLASPVKTHSALFYAAVEAAPGTEIPLPANHRERAIHLLEGAVDVGGERKEPGRMLVFADDENPRIVAAEPVRAMLLGGAPLGERLIWWNLVATRQALIDEAKAAWSQAAENGFPDGVFTLPPDESEFIPLPEK